jgi:hypothetical protein
MTEEAKMQTPYTQFNQNAAQAGSIISTGPQTAREAITHPDKPTDKQCADLDCALDNLDGMLIELRARLDPVIDPSERISEDSVRPPQPMQSRLTTFMETRTLRTWQMGRTLRELIDRLEI